MAFRKSTILFFFNISVVFFGPDFNLLRADMAAVVEAPDSIEDLSPKQLESIFAVMDLLFQKLDPDEALAEFRKQFSSYFSPSSMRMNQAIVPFSDLEIEKLMADFTQHELEWARNQISKLIEAKTIEEINDFKNKYTDRTCYANRSKLISENFLNDYFIFLNNEINNLFYAKKTNQVIVPCISTDGTKSIAYNSSKNKYSINKNITY